MDDPYALLALNPKIAERVNRRLESAYEVARNIVVRHQRAIEYLAGCLLIEETLEGEALEAAIREVRSCMADNGGLDAAS